MRAIVLQQPGGPDVLKLASVELPRPLRGQLRVRHTAIGVNYHDVYVRSGLYQSLTLPGVPGIEAVGVVEDMSSEIAGFEVGDRVGYVTGEYGVYAEGRNLDAASAIKLPDIGTDAQWACSLLKALTACMLLRRVHRLAPQDRILVLAAAGGVGQLLCRWASHLGATVIAAVGSQEKAEVARRCGAAHVILYREQDIAGSVAEITNGEGVAAAFDSVGADTFRSCLDSLAYQGHLISFGQASGPAPSFTTGMLAARFLSVSRPIIFHYLRTPKLLAELSDESLQAFACGAIQLINPLTFPLADAAEAHRCLEAGRSPGGVVLIP